MDGTLMDESVPYAEKSKAFDQSTQKGLLSVRKLIKKLLKKVQLRKRFCPSFKNASYLQKYEQLQKLLTEMKAGLYKTAENVLSVC